MAGSAGGGDTMIAIGRDCAKTLSYAAVHFTVAFGVIYLLTGSVPIATGAALLEPLANTVAYFLHERAWNAFSRRPDLI